MSLKDKVVLVTGGAKGIGQGCVDKFLAEGSKVITFDLDSKAMADQVEYAKKFGTTYSQYLVDVSKEDQVSGAVAKVIAEYGHIDALINCAGIQTYGTVTDTTEEVWDRTFNVNVKSMFFMAKYVVPHMEKNGGGSIVNISSVQSLVSQKSVVAYSASKGAINAMTRAMAIDLASSQIRVNAILPGAVDTPMLRESAELHRGNQTADAVIADWGKSHPLGRLAKAIEIGELAAFLASDAASFITGGSYIIDGGLTTQVPVVLPGK